MTKTLARAAEVPPGTIRAFDASGDAPRPVPRSRFPLLGSIGVGRRHGTRVALANVEGTFHAIDNTCTHRGCSLADGVLEEATVRCACHGSRFDVTTGALLNGPAEEPVRSYPVRVVGDEVQIDL